jgi:hypothetical protein
MYIHIYIYIYIYIYVNLHPNIVISLVYPACNAHTPYCHLWPFRLQYFSALSHKRHDFRKKKRLQWKLIAYVLFFSTNFVLKSSDSKKNWIRYNHKCILSFVDRVSLYNLVNEANLVRKFFLVYLFLFFTCFGRLCAHHQDKQLYLCDNCYLLFCTHDSLVCRVHNLHTRQSSI